MGVINYEPCNACGGEVPIKFIGTNKYNGEEVFDISCLICGQRCIYGRGFAMEPKENAERRIKQYWEKVKT